MGCHRPKNLRSFVFNETYTAFKSAPVFAGADLNL